MPSEQFRRQMNQRLIKLIVEGFLKRSNLKGRIYTCTSQAIGYNNYYLIQFVHISGSYTVLHCQSFLSWFLVRCMWAYILLWPKFGHYIPKGCDGLQFSKVSYCELCMEALDKVKCSNNIKQKYDFNVCHAVCKCCSCYFTENNNVLQRTFLL